MNILPVKINFINNRNLCFEGNSKRSFVETSKPSSLIQEDAVLFCDGACKRIVEMCAEKIQVEDKLNALAIMFEKPNCVFLSQTAYWTPNSPRQKYCSLREPVSGKNVLSHSINVVLKNGTKDDILALKSMLPDPEQYKEICLEEIYSKDVPVCFYNGKSKPRPCTPQEVSELVDAYAIAPLICANNAINQKLAERI